MSAPTVVNSLPALRKAVVKSCNDLKFACVVALTRVAGLAKSELQRRIREDFDRPTPWVINSIYTLPAKKQDDPPFSVVGIKRDAGPYLNIHVTGGLREQKGYEKSLLAGGEGAAVLTANKKMTVIGRKAPRDRYGNLSRTTISKIVSDTVGATTLGYEAKTKKKNVLYRVGKTRRGAPMIYTAQGGAIIPILVGVAKANYQKAFPFEQIVGKVYDDNFSRLIDEAMEQYGD